MQQFQVDLKIDVGTPMDKFEHVSFTGKFQIAYELLESILNDPELAILNESGINRVRHAAQIIQLMTMCITNKKERENGRDNERARKDLQRQSA